MITNVFAAEVAAQHQRDLLVRADTFRRAKAARRATGRLTMTERVAHALQNGWRSTAAVRIRPIRAADQALLLGAFDRLSPRSRQLRFLAPKTRLSAAELRYFTDIDHHDHEALVAVSRFGRHGLGVARYIRSDQDASSADVAVTVIDEWQGLGLGQKLAAQLAARARCEGIRHFTALMAAGNRPARHVLGTLGPVTVVERFGETVLYDVSLTAAEPQRRLPLLRPAVVGCG